MEQAFYSIAAQAFLYKQPALRTSVPYDFDCCSNMIEVKKGVIWHAALPVPHYEIFCSEKCAIGAMSCELIGKGWQL